MRASNGAVLVRHRRIRWKEAEVTDAAHPLLQHRNGDKCIWIKDTGWFVPLDVGGEGYPCENPEHEEILNEEFEKMWRKANPTWRPR